MNFIKAIVDTREFAVRAHGSQRYGEHHYVVHLDEVADLVLGEHIASSGADRLWFLPQDSVYTAYLHDVLEDTLVSKEELVARFGADVAVCVDGLTDPPGVNRRERKELLHERLSRLDPCVSNDRVILVVKASDRLANLRRSCSESPSLLRMYRAEAEAFRAAAFRPGLCDSLWAEIDRICPL